MSSELLGEPVEDHRGPVGQVVALAVLGASFLGCEDAEGLVPRADRVEQGLRVGHGDLLVLGAVGVRRNAQRIRCTTPSSRKLSSFSSAASRLSTPRIHMMWWPG